MNIIIAESISNDFDAMSPALTREHTQDVVSAKGDPECRDLVSKSKVAGCVNPLTKATIFNTGEPKSEFDDSVSYASGTDSLLGLSTNGTVNGVPELRQPHGDLNPVTSRSDSVNERHAMTPRIVSPSVFATHSESVCKMTESNGSAGCGNGSAILGSLANNYTSEDIDSSSLTGLITPSEMEVPKVSDMDDEYHAVEHRISNIITRIRRLQSILATQHATQQITNLVEMQQKQETKICGNLDTSLPNGSLKTFKIEMPSTNADEIGLQPTNTEELNSPSISLSGRQGSHPSTNGMEKTAGRSRKRTRTNSSGKSKKLQKSSGVLCMNINRMLTELDSDATASSSGGETEDEDLISHMAAIGRSKLTFATPATTHSIEKEPCWRWTRDRAMVISRWTWLQAQVSDLEYRIRQHGELHRQLRSTKTPLLAASTTDQTVAEDLTQRAARCSPASVLQPSRHTILRVSQAPRLGRKARRSPVVRCQCEHAIRQCAVCAGDHRYAKPVDIHTLSRTEKLGQVDAGYHPVLSFPRDALPGVQMEQVVNTTDREHASIPSMPTDKKLMKAKKKVLDEAIKKKKMARIKKSKVKKMRKANKKDDDSTCLTERNGIRTKEGKKINHNRHKRPREPSPPCEWDDEEMLETDRLESSIAHSAAINNDLIKSAVAGARRMSSFDIDDIVIPHHFAASTRIQMLHYKEIVTPRFRETRLDDNSVHEEQVEEDISDSRFVARHNVMEGKEKSRYMNFVSSARRPRTHSTSAHAASSLPSPNSNPHEPLPSAAIISPSSPGPLSPAADIVSVPLSASHDAIQLREELVSSTRKRSSSFAASRMRRDQSLDIAEEPAKNKPPWPRRSFPLVDDDDLGTLDGDYQPPHLERATTSSHADPASRRSSQENSASEKWQVVLENDDDSPNHKNSIVLRLSKT